jgi:hypothetical protein
VSCQNNSSSPKFAGRSKASKRSTRLLDYEKVPRGPRRKWNDSTLIEEKRAQLIDYQNIMRTHIEIDSDGEHIDVKFTPVPFALVWLAFWSLITRRAMVLRTPCSSDAGRRND